MTRSALVTGITGFIGRALGRRLVADGWEVHALVRPLSSIDDGVLDKDVIYHRAGEEQDLGPLLRVVGPDVVFHLASLYLAEHQPNQVASLVRSNILLPVRLAEAMVTTGVHRLVNAGTAWQQFRGKDYMPVNLYAATKQAAEDLLLYYHDARDLSVVSLRLFDTYGHGDTRRKLIQILLDAASSGEVLQMSPGEQIVDMTHVEDVVEGFVLAAERLMANDTKINEIYRLSGERHSVQQLVALVAEAAKRPIDVRFGGRPYRAREVMEPVAVNGLSLPGWRRRYDLHSYLELTASCR